MPIELPELDDKTYAQLVEEARAAIPGFHPGWTDHNPSDPGIALVELLAWLSEMLFYRTGQLPEHHVFTFLSLLKGGPYPASPQGSLGEETRSTLRTLRERWRAVTAEDYEYLAMNQWTGAALARVKCLAERDLTGTDKTAHRPGQMSLLVMPAAGSPWELTPDLSSALHAFFRERRVVSTRLHILPPTPVPISISATLYLRDDAVASQVKASAPEFLARHFDPRRGGRGGEGWPFGREVPASEIYATLDTLPGVEFVEDVKLQVAGGQEWRKLTLQGSTSVVAIRLEPYELPQVVSSFELMERRGGAQEWESVP